MKKKAKIQNLSKQAYKLEFLLDLGLLNMFFY